MSNETSDVFGVESGTSTEWIIVGGPIKGSYAVKNGEDYVHD